MSSRSISSTPSARGRGSRRTFRAPPPPPRAAAATTAPPRRRAQPPPPAPQLLPQLAPRRLPLVVHARPRARRARHGARLRRRRHRAPRHRRRHRGYDHARRHLAEPKRRRRRRRRVRRRGGARDVHRVVDRAKADVHSQQRWFYMGQAGELTVDQAHRGYSTATDAAGSGDGQPAVLEADAIGVDGRVRRPALLRLPLVRGVRRRRRRVQRRPACSSSTARCRRSRPPPTPPRSSRRAPLARRRRAAVRAGVRERGERDAGWHPRGAV